MSEFFSSFFLLFLSEMGDKTQMVSFALSCKFSKRVPLLLGIFFAIMLNHGFAYWTALEVAAYFSPVLLRRMMEAIFFILGGWLFLKGFMALKKNNIPENSSTSSLSFSSQEKSKEKSEENLQEEYPFWKIFIFSFWGIFLAEMADKSQISVMGLSLFYPTVNNYLKALPVLAGTISGAFFSNFLIIYIGQKMADYFKLGPKKLMMLAGALFLIFGLISLIQS